MQATRAPQHLRTALRRSIPSAVICAARRSVTYLVRLGVWLRLIMVVKGLTSKDAGVLRQSFLRAPVDSFKRLHVWEDPKLIADADLRIKDLGTFAIRGNSDDLGHVLPFVHRSLFAAMAPLVGRGDTVIDAGANIGAITVFLANLVGPTGHVLAVEMIEETARRLRTNLHLNEITSVSLCTSALSSATGQIVIAHIADGLFGQASIVTDADHGRAVRHIEVRTTTLDELTKDIPSIALIKLDIEGAEADAVAGGAETLRKTRAIVFESWGDDGGRTAVALTDAGFAISRINGRNFLAVRPEERPDAGLRGKGTRNSMHLPANQTSTVRNSSRARPERAYRRRYQTASVPI